MNVKTVERPSLTVVGLGIRTQPMSPEIRALWPRFVARIGEIAQPAEPRVSYGVMRDEGDTLYYLAAASVASDAPVPSGMDRLVIPAGTYASFRYPLSGLGQGFAEIFDQSLPASGYAQVPGQPLFERYDQAFCPDDASSQVEICIPVRRRT